MCGIAGIISPHEARDVAGRKMLGALLHRGPDGENSASFVSERISVFLGNTRLAIVDVENGQQPLTNEDGQLVVVFNGEIYNHKELREELVRRGHSLNSLSDGEVIPHLYEEYGLAAFERLRGMFAIALFDKSDGSLILARDHFGKKPLYYSREGGEVAFASEVKSLLMSRNFAPSIDMDSIALFLKFGFIPAPNSAFKGISKVRAGHAIRLTLGSMTEHKFMSYASPPEPQDPAPQTSLSTESTELRDQIDRAVMKTIPDEVEWGVFFSGGIDSALVAESAYRQTGCQLSAYSIRFPGSTTDESLIARTSAKALGLNYQELDFPTDPTVLIEAMGSSFDEPNADVSILPTLLVSKLASDQGKKVVLTGDGGDELFGGYEKYFMAMRASQILDTKAGNIALKFSNKIAKRLTPGGALTEHRVAEMLGRLEHGGSPAALNWGISQNYLTDSEIVRLLGSDFQPQGPLDRFWYDSSRLLENSENSAGKLLDSDLMIYLPGILQKVDISTMTYGLEARSPLLDFDLYKYARSLNQNRLFTRDYTKIALRNLASESLPRDVYQAKKQGFVPDRLQLVQNSAGKGIRDLLLSRDSKISKYLNHSAMVEIWEQLEQGKNKSRQIWVLFVLAIWLEAWTE